MPIGGGGIPLGAATTITSSEVSVGTSSVTALAANSARKHALFVNDSNTVIYLKLGATAETNKGIRLGAEGGAYEIGTTNPYTGIVTAISSAASKNLMVSEG